MDYWLGTPGQGNAKPAALFPDHGLVYMYGTYYDPSYGKAYSSLQEFEDEAIHGFIRGVERDYGNVTIMSVLFRKNFHIPFGVIGIPDNH